MPNRSGVRKAAAVLLSIGLAAGLGACSSQVLKKIGEACTIGGDCGSGICSTADKVCTRPCAKQLDCPVGSNCGYAHPADALKGGYGPSCVKALYTNPATGGYGTSCGGYSPDPNDATNVCDATAANPCADGFTCLGSARCDANALCTKACKVDAECPSNFYCATETASGCTVDGDCKNDYTCQSSGGGRAGKVCTRGAWCKPRAQCAPCVSTDDCETGFVCAIANGERYCGKKCDPAGAQPCPEAPLGTHNNFMNCVDSGTGGGAVCQPAQGACHGKSAFPDFDTSVGQGAICSWCRAGIPSDCPDGFCVVGQTEENFCSVRCTVTTMLNAQGQPTFDTTTDTCPTNLHCLLTKLPACGKNCTGPSTGFCNGDDPADPAGQAVTCFP